MKKQRTLITDIGPENDVKFACPISYRHLRAAAWVFLALAQLAVIFKLFAGQIEGFALPSVILSMVSSVAAPLLLLAAFAQVLTAKNGYKKLIFLYVGGAIGIYLAFIFIFFHYAVGLFGVLSKDAKTATDISAMLIQLLAKNGFIAFNVFIDLALCALWTFFLNFHPKQFFQGKWIYLFRSFAVLPILWEVASIVLKLLAANQTIMLSPFVYPLLATKPPFSFLVFVFAAVFVKVREQIFLRRGKTLEDYNAFLDTKANRKQVSRFLMVIIGVCAIVDVVVFVAASVVAGANAVAAAGIDPADEEAMLNVIETVIIRINATGLGNCFPMLFIIPVVAFFDYRKTYENPMFDRIIPLAGVGLIALVYLEGLFQFAKFSLAKLLAGEPSQDPVSSSIVGLLEKLNK